MQKEEQTQINFIELCKEGIICIDEENKINFFNNAAQKILKSNSEDALNKCLQEVNAECHEKIKDIIGQRNAIKIKINDKTFIAISSPVMDDGKYLGSTVMFIENYLINQATCNQMYLNRKDKKRTFDEIRKKILITLSNSKKTINQISIETNINWKTVEKHLTYLLGKKMIDEVYSSEYLRIFDVSERGKNKLEEIKIKEKAKLMHEE